MNFFSLSNVGMVRPKNEDYAESFQYKWCDIDGKCHSFTALLLSDGMGGSVAGEWASNSVVGTFKSVILKNLLEENPEAFAKSDLKEFITQTTNVANQTIYQKALDNPEMEGMGATQVICLVYNDTLTIGHVGDSRGYLLREGVYKQITHDHSMVQELIDKGKITKEEAENHPNKNIITRATGVSPQVEAECIQMPIFVGDIIMLCSDGLTGFTDEKAVSRYLKEKTSGPFPILPVIGRELIEMANGGGGADNISVCLYRHTP